ncbi:MAG: glycogen synthase [Actinomycetes bacterium]
MRVALLTREYPPEVYGGAGVHVDFLVQHLRRLVDVDVHCFGAARREVSAYVPDPELASANAALGTLSVDLRMAAALAAGRSGRTDGSGPDLVHSHTWYTNFAGHLDHLVSGRPHVVTAHSLEPLRPWKAEQLGGGYAVSSFVERLVFTGADAVIAVSVGMRHDVLACYPELDPARVHVVHNGIDPELYAPVDAPDVVARLGVDPQLPYVLFVGRITRQKGLAHLLAAAHELPDGVALVLAAGAPDTPEIAEQTAREVDQLRRSRRDPVIWLDQMVAREDLVALFSHATVFACPSVYEPLGIVNLEAMACATPVVASAVGGIPEVVEDGRTGLLVAYDPQRPEAFERGLARGITELLADPDRARRMGAAGRVRAVREFGWETVARRTVDVYEAALGS